MLDQGCILVKICPTHTPKRMFREMYTSLGFLCHWMIYIFKSFLRRNHQSAQPTEGNIPGPPVVMDSHHMQIPNSQLTEQKAFNSRREETRGRPILSPLGTAPLALALFS